MEDNITACLELARSLFSLKREEEGVRALLQSFVYDTPRTEICCQLGYHFKGKGNYRLAALWLSLVENLQKPVRSWGF